MVNRVSDGIWKLERRMDAVEAAVAELLSFGVRVRYTDPIPEGGEYDEAVESKTTYEDAPS